MAINAIKHISVRPATDGHYYLFWEFEIYNSKTSEGVPKSVDTYFGYVKSDADVINSFVEHLLSQTLLKNWMMYSVDIYSDWHTEHVTEPWDEYWNCSTASSRFVNKFFNLAPSIVLDNGA